MLIFKIIRKIGKMLRGGAGKKEIFLGALCGVLIGFNPVSGLMLSLAILMALLLNANIGFTLLGVALGKLLSLALAPISFHTGYFMIHNMGLEGFFTTLANAPVVALMNLDVYAMIGSLPFSMIIGIAFGMFMSTTVTKVREQMVKAGEHEKVGKAVDSKFAKFLMWLVFGKQKISTTDVLAKESPLLRKSGLILVGSVLVLGLLLNFLLLDVFLKKSIQSSIGKETGAEVNIGKARLSLAGGELKLRGLEVVDPDKLTHNLLQLDTLTADMSISDLLRKTYTIDLLAGSTLQRDVLRDKPGKLLEAKSKKKKDEKPADEKESGKSLETYFAKAGEWKEQGGKVTEYLQKRKENAEAIAKGEKPKASKEAALALAKKVGYLKATADLVARRAAWTIHRIEIDNVLLGGDLPAQNFQALELSSHPELNGLPTTFALTPEGATEPTAKVTLRFDDPAAAHEVMVTMKGIALDGETSGSFPVDLNDGKADISANGTFTTDALNVPFVLFAHDLKAEIDELEIEGELGGTLAAPRVSIDYDKLKSALAAAGKKKLTDRADKEMDKLMESDEVKDAKKKAKDAFKKLF